MKTLEKYNLEKARKRKKYEVRKNLQTRPALKFSEFSVEPETDWAPLSARYEPVKFEATRPEPEGIHSN